MAEFRRKIPAVELLNTKQAAERMGVTVARIQQWIWDGRLPAIRPGRDYLIDGKDLENIIELRRGRPKGSENGKTPSKKKKLAIKPSKK